MANKELITVLKNGGVSVYPTDTLYGILTSAFDKNAVERVYKIKGRNPKKAPIILIDSVSRLKDFDVVLIPVMESFLDTVWPAKVSVVLPLGAKGKKKFAYLHRGTNTLAFRVPKSKRLQYLLRLTGPLIAPSANPEGMPPASTILEAKNYFGKKIDLYVAGGKKVGKPSTLLRLHKDGTAEVLR